MAESLRVALAQINFTVGALQSNAQKILNAARQAHALKVDVLVLPELALTGYQPEDLLLRPQFLMDQSVVLQNLCKELENLDNLYVVLGHIEQMQEPELRFYAAEGSAKPRGLFNTASILYQGRTLLRYHKQELPNYGVFDECRYFTRGYETKTFELKGHCFALAICEDLWLPHVAEQAALANAQSLLVLNASPYSMGKHQQRLQVLRKHASKHKLTSFYCNLVGGQDELLFDGHSFVLTSEGHELTGLNSFVEGLAIYQLHNEQWQAQEQLPLQQMNLNNNVSTVALSADKTLKTAELAITSVQESIEAEVWRGLVLATQDYVHKNGFQRVVLGLSGGIDSAVVLSVAVEAVGAENVTAVMMHSKYTADISVSDATKMAKNLQVAYHEIEIETLQTQFLSSLSPLFGERPHDTTEENLQARIRGVLLMALSNKFGCLVLPTGNKSELATGYCTLYGDMVGSFAMLKDVPKSLVYRLAKWRNQIQQVVDGSEIIPEQIITRPPSAELSEGQTDQDSLPAYDVLDAIIERIIEHNMSVQAIIAEGFNKEDVEKTARLIKINEYKRRQGALGPKITDRAFGRDWRYPISHTYRF